MNPRFLFIAVCGLTLTTSHAAVFTVNNTLDSGAGSLRQAISDANILPGDDTIALAITGTIALNSQLPAITSNTTITGLGTNFLTVSGSGKYRVFTMSAGTTNTLSGFVIAYGAVTNAGNGAGISNASNLTLSSCVVATNNSVGGFGGAIFNAGNLLLLNSALIGNTSQGNSLGNPAESGKGGGLFVADGLVQITNCVFLKNEAYGGVGIPSSGVGGEGAGGALHLEAGVVRLDGTEISQNASFGGQGGLPAPGSKSGSGGDGMGGAISIKGGSLILGHSVLQNNFCSGGIPPYESEGPFWAPAGNAKGGGVCILGGELAVDAVTMRSNSAQCILYAKGGQSQGGAIYAEIASWTVRSSTFVGNRASGGNGYVVTPTEGLGGAWFLKSGVLCATNCTLAGNEAVGGDGADIMGNWSGAGGYGAAVFVGGGAMTNVSNTLVSNRSVGGLSRVNVFPGGPAVGGGFHNAGGTVVLLNTLLSGNSATNSGDDFNGEVTSLGYNMFSKSNGLVGAQSSDLLEVNANVGPLQNNGGFTWTIALLAGSPAIDRGTSGGLLTDQRGMSRPYDALGIPNGSDGSDIGAYEATLNPPFVIQQPVSLVVTSGGNATFSVTAGGDAPLSYEWRFKGATILNATGTTLSLTNLQYTDSGDYSVVVTNLSGSTTSAGAALTVLTSPYITAQPQDQSVVAGQNATFAVTADGTTPLSYQWRLDGTNIINATNAVYMRAGVQAEDAGTYELIVTNSRGSITSSVATLTVLFPPSITKQPLNQLVAKGSNVVFSVAAAGTPPLTFQWRFNGGNLSGATADHYFVNNAQSFNSGGYSVIVSNPYGWLTSSVATLAVIVPPTIASQPKSQTAYRGATVLLSAGINGTTPAFQWFKDGLVISGQTNAEIRLVNVQTNDGGIYTLMASNYAGSVTSSPAALTVRDLAVSFVTVWGNGQIITNSETTFVSSVAVNMASVFTNGVIYYTLTGTSPTYFDAPYSGTLFFNRTVILRAIAYSSDFLQSAEVGPYAINVVPAYQLNVVNRGGGTVTLDPPTGPYPSNSIVKLLATPAPGWALLQWLGDLAGNALSNNLAMNQPKVVEAVFGSTLETTVAGGGAVYLTPAGGIYPYGTQVRLYAVPGAGSGFSFWGNAGSGTNNPLLLTVLNPALTVSSVFSPLSAGQHALAVLPVGAGQLIVNPALNRYTNGQNVTITAVPDPGQAFLGWSGDAGGAISPLVVGMNQSKVITGSFNARPSLRVGTPLEGITEDGFRLTVLGQFGITYDVLGSTNLQDWSSVGTVTNTYGTSQITDPAATPPPYRFYRARPQ